MAKSLKRKRVRTRQGRLSRLLAGLLLLTGASSCVPLASAEQRAASFSAVIDLPSAAMPAAGPLIAQTPPPLPEPAALEPVAPLDAEALNAAIPIVQGATARPDSIVFRAQSAWDQQRSLQCLAETIYYEARSESEEGQRAVAQVVLNRVRHPAFPKSVCGVVYQGPLRAGGGCQFTFTCDGSLASPPAGIAWERARRLAASALAGSVYAPVGYATNYHTQYVLPLWAYKLVKSAVIGSHSFYRLPGDWGEPAAFRAAYAGREPAPAALLAARPRPAPLLPASLARSEGGLILPPPTRLASAGPRPEANRLDDRLPDSGIRDEYRTSGQWLAQPGEAALR
jgi:spore germination cell wall hydrolase CwlJ-like protein